MADVTAIVLAAGLSRRMGKDNKLFLPFGDSTIVETVVQKIKASKVNRIVVVGSKLSYDQLQKMMDEKTTVVDNPDYETGMTSSIKTGVNAVSNTDGYMICLGDQPLIDTSIYNSILLSFIEAYPLNDGTITVPFHMDKKGNPVIFSSTYRKDILAHKEPEGCKEIVQANKENVSKVSVSDSSILADIDTKEDFLKMKG